jgi:hypothetical protein
MFILLGAFEALRTSFFLYVATPGFQTCASVAAPRSADGVAPELACGDLRRPYCSCTFTLSLCILPNLSVVHSIAIFPTAFSSLLAALPISNTYYELRPAWFGQNAEDRRTYRRVWVGRNLCSYMAGYL